MNKLKKKQKLYTNINFKWKDYRLGECLLTEERNINKLADAITRALIGNTKVGLREIEKYKGTVADYISSKSKEYNEQCDFIHNEIINALDRIIRRISKN